MGISTAKPQAAFSCQNLTCHEFLSLPGTGTPLMLTWSLRQLSIYPLVLVLARESENSGEKSFFIIYAHT